MSRRNIRNVAASVHQRLLNFNRERGLDFTLVLTRYALERWLYRLGKSEFCDRFVLKGAMLFTVWAKDPFRTTRDLDLLGFGSLTGEDLRHAFSGICQTNVEPDGLRFDDENMTVEPIREGEEYQGQRVRLYARMNNIRISLQIDVGMGDALWPEPEMIHYPTLLDMPAPKIRAYRKETVVAEKLEAMVSLGELNSRMKDFFDVAVLADQLSFEGEDLQKAIEGTFRRRKTVVPSIMPVAFTKEFGGNHDKQTQWNAFLKRMGKEGRQMPFAGVVEGIREFLWPVLLAISTEEPFMKDWPSGGPWRSRE